ncbi:hypothetical protein FRC10_003894 [Ceratobasidium sp. 414]|nr:hypothetical protein FRC10_003894 [Ceratobasidium sp. 414]
MPHLRFNTKSSSPNPYFNFTSALPSFLKAPGLPTQQNAMELLGALAAQVRPICKKHGFTVNSFEEVLCHELAHIKHMNHGAGFQQLNSQLCHEVAVLRSKGYYGDGRGLGASDFDLPEYMCGGAQQRQRASTLRRGPRRNGPRATNAKRRKAGTRVTSKYAFEGDGQTLNAHIVDEAEKKKGTGFRKSAQSAKERQARLEAIEKRLKASQPSPATTEAMSSTTPDEDSDQDLDEFEETDESRRKLLADTGAGWKFDSTLDKKRDIAWDDDILNLISDSEVSESREPSSNVPGPSFRAKDVGLGSSSAKAEKLAPGLANMVRSEIEYRKRERLGLVGERRLGGGNSATSKSRLLGPDTTQPIKLANRESEQSGKEANSGHGEHERSDEWACLVCTWTMAFVRPVQREEGKAAFELMPIDMYSFDVRIERNTITPCDKLV